ncbi:MAG: hypothetical protein GKS00_13530 [Alphaproteobacteria bacterium]|nr:hypothetical protein [Alphaproteobacteria bacterium]
MAKVESLHGTTPAEIFESGLENLEQIQSIALSVTWRDGRVTSGWSNAPPTDLAYMLLALDEKFRDENLRD